MEGGEMLWVWAVEVPWVLPPLAPTLRHPGGQSWDRQPPSSCPQQLSPEGEAVETCPSCP